MQGFLLVMALAVASEAEQCNAGVCWQVSPSTCITERIDQPCQSPLSVQWHSQNQQSLCIVLAKQNLHCWSSASSGSWQKAIPWANETLFLKTEANTFILQTKLKVLSRQPVKRRRLNGPWSLF